MDVASRASMVTNMVQEARDFATGHNSTTIVAGMGLALAIMYLITTISLYSYYYAGVGIKRRSDTEGVILVGKQDQKTGRQDYDFTLILDLLEQFFASNGVREQECREKIVCEAAMSTAEQVNKIVSEELNDIMMDVNKDVVQVAEPGMKKSIINLIRAKNEGQKKGNCDRYKYTCPHRTLVGLPQLK